MDHLAGCRCIIPGILCDREWDQEEIVKNIEEKYQRGRERHCVGELLSQESCFWVIGLIWMRLFRKAQ